MDTLTGAQRLENYFEHLLANIRADGQQLYSDLQQIKHVWESTTNQLQKVRTYMRQNLLILTYC